MDIFLTPGSENYSYPFFSLTHNFPLPLLLPLPSSFFPFHLLIFFQIFLLSIIFIIFLTIPHSLCLSLSADHVTYKDQKLAGRILSKLTGEKWAIV